eukprot:CAMPEP_0170151820 /NCGR_PEP_ID=MMETSP0033_2-20121228/50672_1 /TAXON_ID=195969 /ORGANISM="Dolichomastix tenuilepis, Strain CCMP3274" /LENGTH=73 /DNA_ID=CAMNT_0010388935 /DNA_START=25 /DNA_END=243 /DNA_ORIENTATION=+
MSINQDELWKLNNDPALERTRRRELIMALFASAEERKQASSLKKMRSPRGSPRAARGGFSPAAASSSSPRVRF